MSTRPIVLLADEISALRSGTADLRRSIEPQPTKIVTDWSMDSEPGDAVIYRGQPAILYESRGRNKSAVGELTPRLIKCPFGKKGDHLCARVSRLTLELTDVRVNRVNATAPWEWVLTVRVIEGGRDA